MRKTPIVPSNTAAALERYVPDLANWPRSWHYVEADLPVGARIVESFKPFLLDLLAQGLAAKTLRRHRDYLWMLGGEIIRRRYDDPDLASMTIDDALLELVDEEGGPLLSSRASEPEQEAFDATCRKLYRFLSQRKSC